MNALPSPRRPHHRPYWQGCVRCMLSTAVIPRCQVNNRTTEHPGQLQPSKPRPKRLKSTKKCLFRFHSSPLFSNFSSINNLTSGGDTLHMYPRLLSARLTPSACCEARGAALETAAQKLARPRKRMAANGVGWLESNEPLNGVGCSLAG